MEVSKLSLPADEVVGITHGEPELEAENCKLGERAVADCVPGLVRGDVLQGTKGGLEIRVRLGSSNRK